jgi:hypothetical protein
MVLLETQGLDGTAGDAAEIRTANWELARAAIDGLGDAWDLEETTFELLCECGRIGCRSTIVIALLEYVDARSNGHDLVAPCHENPLDLVIARGDGYRAVARAARRHARPAVGDWSCRCGQSYRVATRGSHLILWPRNSATGFRRDPIGEHCVNGCAIDRVSVLYEVIDSEARSARPSQVARRS